jgi:hypothetical protein
VRDEWNGVRVERIGAMPCAGARQRRLEPVHIEMVPQLGHLPYQCANARRSLLLCRRLLTLSQSAAEDSNPINRIQWLKPSHRGTGCTPVHDRSIAVATSSAA